jgi:hypothetical protein
VDCLKFCHKLKGEEDATRFAPVIIGHFQRMKAKMPMGWYLGPSLRSTLPVEVSYIFSEYEKAGQQH